MTRWKSDNGCKKGKPRGKPFKCGFDERRHPLTILDCRKGYFVFKSKVERGLIPSRVASYVKSKMRIQRQAKKGVAV